jgi:hypothetical protein
VIRSEKTGKHKTCNSPYWTDETFRANVMKVGLYHDVRTVVNWSKFGIDRLSRRTLEKRPIPLLAYIVSTALHCVTALQHDHSTDNHLTAQ